MRKTDRLGQKRVSPLYLNPVTTHLCPMPYPTLPHNAPIVAPLVDLSATPATYRQRAPLAGEHTHDILLSLGYQTHELAAISGVKPDAAP